jgi:hypothetical protein
LNQQALLQLLLLVPFKFATSAHAATLQRYFVTYLQHFSVAAGGRQLTSRIKVEMHAFWEALEWLANTILFVWVSEREANISLCMQLCWYQPVAFWKVLGWLVNTILFVWSGRRRLMDGSA